MKLIFSILASILFVIFSNSVLADATNDALVQNLPQNIILADADTDQMIINGAQQIAKSVQCSTNCLNRQSSCIMRCRSYRNNDPQGVACVMDCSNDYNQCTSNCQ